MVARSALLPLSRSGGKVYHALIFHRGGQYSLDIAGDNQDEEEQPTSFNSLDDLVVFCMSHQLRMEGDTVHLKEVIHCKEGLAQPDGFPTESNGGECEVRTMYGGKGWSRQQRRSELLALKYSCNA